mmetsp:Transcript_52093/g.137622  ORF Transcript_52093/g.137622 Transcript_52093/m.137622 type:complete len:481 (-) Transcript_52093:20-1462(-)
MGNPPGTTLQEPVTVEQTPDLGAGLHEIKEYFQQQGAYDLLDNLLKDLMIHQPADPLGHMLKCLSSEVPTGPLRVVLASAPGLGRNRWAGHIADHFGLEHICAGDLLKEAGADTNNVGYHCYNDEEKVAHLVIERIKQCHDQMKGWVLNGFPRTRFQATFLKEHSVVPTHVLVLQADVEGIRKRQQAILSGEIEGAYTPPEALEQKLRLHSCHCEVALETYKDLIHLIDTEKGEDAAWSQIETKIRLLPRSRGPHPPPRVVILGPRGVGTREHASLLAARLGAVFVDGLAPLGKVSGPAAKERDLAGLDKTTRSITTMDVPNIKAMVAGDLLGEVGVRLRCSDCTKQGFVLCHYPAGEEMARALANDPRLRPTRVVALTASAEVCIARLRHLLTDPITGQIWTTVPRSAEIRKRAVRRSADAPARVQEDYDEYSMSIDLVLEELGLAHSVRIGAEEAPQAVFAKVAEFVERPLSLPPKDS